MEFSVSSQELTQQLNRLIGPIAPNASMPSLEEFLFVLSGDELTITSSDLETTITSVITVSSEDSGRFMCPSRMLLDTVKGLQDQPITIEVNTDTRQVTLTSAYGKYSMTGHDPDDYPAISRPTDIDTILLPADILLSAINKTVLAASNDEMRRTMMGVFFQIDFNKIVFVATDAHKLVKYSYTALASDVTTSFILTKKSMNLLKSVLDPSQEVTIEFDKKHASFTQDKLTVNCVMLEGKYPDYNMVIPKDNPNTLKVRKVSLMNALKRLSIFANRATNQTIFNITEDSLTMTSQDIEVSNEATEQLECEYSGEDIFIAFNAKFLSEVVSVIQDEEIIFKIEDTTRPVLIFPEEQEPEQDLLTLIMPVAMGY